MTGWLPSCLGAVGGGLVAAAALAGPRLVAEAPVHEFGAVERGTRVSRVFKVSNQGDGPATIAGVDSACACTVGAVRGQVVAPGRTAWVSVELDTGGIAGPTAKSVSVRTTDPGAPAVRLTVQGTVLADVVAEPPVLYLGEVRRGSGVEREVAVRAGRPLGGARVIGVEARGPFVEARLAEDGASGQRVLVRLAGGAPAGRFREEVVLRTTGAGDGRVVLPVLGRVRGEIDVQPPLVRLDGRPGGGGARAVVQVVNRGARAVAVREVRVPRDVATYELETVRRGFEYALHLELRRGLRSRALVDRIEILTDHPSEPRLEVPLYAVAARAPALVR